MQFKNNKDKSWIEVSENALLTNLYQFQKIAGKNSLVVPVVKANAYGHGLTEVVSILKSKVKFFAVDNINEALLIKKIDSSLKVLILGYTTYVNLIKAINENISFVVSSIETLEKIVSLKNKKKALIHLKIETGLNRQGVKLGELIRFLDFIKINKSKFRLEGVSTHFADIEDTLDSRFANKQLTIFNKSLKLIKDNGFNPPLTHCAASAGTMLYKKTHFSMVRVGIGIYGLWPSSETHISLLTKKKKIILEPVLKWKSIISQIKFIKTGESVGYGRTWISSRNSKIAIVPIGYSDGFDRGLSNIGRVIINNNYAKVVGRVAMNMIMVDITDIGNIKVEDEVTIIGKENDLEVSADEWAKKLDTINYEVVSRINPLLSRKIINI